MDIFWKKRLMLINNIQFLIKNHKEEPSLESKVCIIWFIWKLEKYNNKTTNRIAEEFRRQTI